MKRKIAILSMILIVQVIIAYTVLSSMIRKKEMQLYPEDFPVEMTSYNFGELVVNPSGTRGRRYFIIDIVLRYPADSTDFPTIFEDKKHALTDSMMTTMMGKTIEELTAIQGREELRNELEGIFYTIAGTKIDRLLFRKYLIQ